MGVVVRRRCLPSDGSRAECDRDGSHLHWQPRSASSAPVSRRRSHSPSGGRRRRRRSRRFCVTLAGIGVLLALVQASSNVLAFAPGLLLIGLGLGLMLTPLVNIVQSSRPEEQQGEISGLSRSISNPARRSGPRSRHDPRSDLASGNDSYALAMVPLGVAALIGPGRRCSYQPNSSAQQLDRSAPEGAAGGEGAREEGDGGGGGGGWFDVAARHGDDVESPEGSEDASPAASMESVWMALSRRRNTRGR